MQFEPSDDKVVQLRIEGSQVLLELVKVYPVAHCEQVFAVEHVLLMHFSTIEQLRQLDPQKVQ